MMDGQVARIRQALDENGFKDTAIMSYSAKFASGFYGPFREALMSSMKFGDRKSYQMDYRNSSEALREIELDVQEGADIVMIKPALGYLDIIAKARERFNIPIAAYNVSGEYAMVKAYTQDQDAQRELVLEILTAIKRAGADIIISYHTKTFLRI
jgi:porphobilinogen synthase